MGMRLPQQPEPAPKVLVQPPVVAQIPTVVVKETTRPDTGPISRSKGSVVELPDYPERKTR